MVFFFGFFLTMAGIALLLSGGFRLKTKRLSKRAARWSGATFVAFFPLVLLVYFAARKIDPEENVPADVYFWSLAVLDLAVGLTIFFRGLKPLGRRPAGSTGTAPGSLEPFPPPEDFPPPSAPAIEPPPAVQHPGPTPRKGGYVPPTESPFELPGDSPFDFR